MNWQSDTLKRFMVVTGLSLLFGGGLAVLVLFNLPFFYHLNKIDAIQTIVSVVFFFSLIVGFSYRILFIPIRAFQDRNTVSVILVSVLSLMLGGIYSLTSVNYWLLPQLHHVEICYQSEEQPDSSVKLLKLYDFKTGRFYPASDVEQNKYPVLIPSGTCIAGDVQALVREGAEWEGLAAVFSTKSENAEIFIGINSVMANLPLAITNIKDNTATIVLQAGVENGLDDPFWGAGWLALLKWGSLILSAVYSAFLVFGVSELIVSPFMNGMISHRTLLVFVFAYFIIFAFSMSDLGGQPDQVAHVYYSVRYSETWGRPVDDFVSPFHIAGREYFYYWINGAAAKLLNFINWEETYFSIKQVWRYISILISTITLFYFYKITSLVVNNKYAGVLAAFMGANTLMFVFISSGVSYDNLMNLASAAAIFHFLKVFEGGKFIEHSASLGIWACVSALTKLQSVLLAFILFVIWLFYTLKNKNRINFSKFTPISIALLIALVVLASLVVDFYVGNIYEYGGLLSRCTQVKADELCTNFREREAQQVEIDLGELWEDRHAIIGPFEYAINYWIFNKINGIWGIISKNTFVPKFSTSLHGVLILASLFCMVRYWRRQDVLPLLLAAIVLIYTGYVFFMNYSSELQYEFRHYAVQGRYLFPVYGAFLAIMVDAFLRIPSLITRKIIIVVLLVIYISGGLGVFVFRYADVFISWRLLT